MREIKFRAILKGKIVGHISLYEPLPNGGFTASNFGGSYDHLEQYTGLKDKNGKEIYEGDICRVRLQKGVEFLAELVWYHLGWKMRSIEGQGGVGDWGYKYFENPKDVEVIGNIYENPELIK